MKKHHVTTTINGEATEFLCEPSLTMLDVLRDELQLTGSKEGCSSGDCGACSITVDGRLVPLSAKNPSWRALDSLPATVVLHVDHCDDAVVSESSMNTSISRACELSSFFQVRASVLGCAGSVTPAALDWFHSA